MHATYDKALAEYRDGQEMKLWKEKLNIDGRKNYKGGMDQRVYDGQIVSKCICPDWENFRTRFSKMTKMSCSCRAEQQLIDTVELLWCFAKVGIRLTDWPGNSPDLNLIGTNGIS